MKEEILEKAGEMFLKLGFKSVTMDDIANEMAMSKKTLYKYFKNKEVLVEESTSMMHEACHMGIQMITDQGYNPIRENFEIKKMFKEMFKNADSSPIFQLKKYYPKIHERVMCKEMGAFSECVKQNINRGIEQGYYREQIDIDLCIQFYFAIVFSIHENAETENRPEFEVLALEYHTRAIATEKGITELENQLLNYTS
ncbi:TetR family transcriptional regulator [Leptobacterium flavescens]|uniref:TetR family transcriptional regulator n=1 Tax=Leptobacterium flavescens TaxID=472055 RepID=A0A6P0UKJ3_9FLAO|nr:TetR/AcrR family transcriptional regulator [Leptobacterium flavescens]NER13072.1 TetR family transcriptional regulator [Leptobacterium flavescens]